MGFLAQLKEKAKGLIGRGGKAEAAQTEAPKAADPKA
jgi:hypothetical protein